jgi:hypothetical protein
MKIVIYATHADGMYNILIDLLKKHGYPIQILGWGDTWQGFHQRTLVLHNYISQLDPNEIVVCLDGFDTLAIDTPTALMEKFYSLDVPCLWSSEYDNIGYKKCIFGGILNGGMYMGYAGSLTFIYKTIIDEYGSNALDLDDQKIINDLYNRNVNDFQDLITVDVDNLIFANISYENPLNYLTNIGSSKINYVCCGDERIINRRTGAQPIFISGPGNINMKQFLDKLGYSDDYPKRPGYITGVLKNFKFEVSVCIIICCIVIGLIFFILGRMQL